MILRPNTNHYEALRGIYHRMILIFRYILLTIGLGSQAEPNALLNKTSQPLSIDEKPMFAAALDSLTQLRGHLT